MGRLILFLLTIQVVQVYAATRPMFNLYTDRKGKKVGDVLTVMVVENSSAKNKASTELDKRNAWKMGIAPGTGMTDFIPGMGFEGKTGSDFDGKGSTARQGQLKATVSVRIEEVLDNGNLRIYGIKEVTLNEETETIEVSGIIRPEDIGSNNTVVSPKIAEAVIKYVGDGVLNEVEEPGILTRLFNWIF